MVIQKIGKPVIEIQKSIQENIKAQEAGSFHNPILNRCIDQRIDLGCQKSA